MVNRLSAPFLFQGILALLVLAGAGGAGFGRRSCGDSRSVDRMERDLLSRVTGDGVQQRRLSCGQDPRPPPPPTLTLRMASAAEEPQSRADAAASSHYCHAPQQAHAPAPAPAANMAAPSTSSRPPFASHRLMASVVVPGYPMAERRYNLLAGAAGARAQAGHGQTACAPRASPAGPAPPRPPATTLVLPTLEQLAGPAAAAAGKGQQERCGACGLSSQLLRGLSSDLDRARAQVALLTCQNESLRSRLKRAAAAAETTAPAASSSAHQMDLRCGACRVRPATVVLEPQEHLCLCDRCSDACRGGAAVACPVCRADAAPR